VPSISGQPRAFRAPSYHTVHTFGEGVCPMGGINSALAGTLWGQVDKNVFEYAESCK